MKITIDKSKLNQVLKAVEEGFGDAVAALDKEYVDVIEDPNEFGDLGFRNQDIVDTGRFRESQKVIEERTEHGVEVKWHWNPVDPESGYQYAPALYAGYSAFGKKWIPGRPWPERAVKRVDPGKVFEDGVKNRL